MYAVLTYIEKNYMNLNLAGTWEKQNVNNDGGKTYELDEHTES